MCPSCTSMNINRWFHCTLEINLFTSIFVECGLWSVWQPCLWLHYNSNTILSLKLLQNEANVWMYGCVSCAVYRVHLIPALPYPMLSNPNLQNTLSSFFFSFIFVISLLGYWMLHLPQFFAQLCFYTVFNLFHCASVASSQW